VVGLLARAYRESGRHEEALVLYARLLGEDPLDRRAREGLLLAAAGTGDRAQLEESWQQICVCLGGEGDPDMRGLYERLLHEVRERSEGSETGAAAAAGGSS
jgi:DNA-binding SARP family transcriptional activator